MSKKETRVDIPQISKQWVQENCSSITPRDIAVLKLLYENKRRILKRNQIQQLLPQQYKFPSINRLNKRLKLLYEMHIIDKIYPKVPNGKGSSQQHICLDRAGIILLDIYGYNKPIRIDSMGNKVLPLGWNHKVMINDCECMYNRVFDSILMYKAEEPVKFGINTIIPDSICVARKDKKGYSIMLEVDMGTEDIKVIKRKIDKYIELYLSHIWESMEWSKIFKKPVFPRVIITLSSESGRRFKDILEYTKEKSVRFIVTTHDKFETTILNIVK